MSKKARDRKKQLRKDIREYKQYLKNKFEEVEKQVVLHTFLDIKGSEYNFNEPTIKWQTPTPEPYDGNKINHIYEDEPCYWKTAYLKPQIDKLK